jgi:hypothetical protein
VTRIINRNVHSVCELADSYLAHPHPYAFVHTILPPLYSRGTYCTLPNPATFTHGPLNDAGHHCPSHLSPRYRRTVHHTISLPLTVTREKELTRLVTDIVVPTRHDQHALDVLEWFAFVGREPRRPGFVGARVAQVYVDLDGCYSPRRSRRRSWLIGLLGEDGGGAEEDDGGGKMHD